MSEHKENKESFQEKNAKTILIVDDEYVVIDVLGSFLKEKNYKVIHEVDPLGVEKIVLEKKPDLIFLDNRMYPLTGKEILRRLRKKGVQTPIVMMSAYKTRDGIFEMKKLGAIDYIGKPFDFKKISKILSKYL